jgi:hypothetical protein
MSCCWRKVSWLIEVGICMIMDIVYGMFVREMGVLNGEGILI